MKSNFLLRFVRCLSLIAVLSMLGVMAGCTTAIFTGAYLLGYGDTQAEFKELKEKRVVVICRPLVELRYSDMNASRVIARDVGKLLRKNVKKIEIVDPQKVDEWLDSHVTEDYAEIGRALKADMVVAVDLLDFGIYLDQTLYQGKTNYDLKVIDCKTGNVAFRKPSNQSLWPPNTGVPTSDKPEQQFRQQYIGVLADEIARHFYAFDHRNYFSVDADAFN